MFRLFGSPPPPTPPPPPPTQENAERPRLDECKYDFTGQSGLNAYRRGTKHMEDIAKTVL